MSEKRILKIETYRFDHSGQCYSYLLPGERIIGIAHTSKEYDKKYGYSWEVDLLIVEEMEKDDDVPK